MKKILIISLMLACGNLVRAEYAIVRSTMGSGGTVLSGTFAVGGIVGESPAWVSVSGRYRVVGGYLAQPAELSAPRALRLTIRRDRDQVVVAWPLTAAGWVLEQTSRLDGPSSAWTEVPGPYLQSDTENHITLRASQGRAFFRLRQP